MIKRANGTKLVHGQTFPPMVRAYLLGREGVSKACIDAEACIAIAACLLHLHARPALAAEPVVCWWTACPAPPSAPARLQSCLNAARRVHTRLLKLLHGEQVSDCQHVMYKSDYSELLCGAQHKFTEAHAWGHLLAIHHISSVSAGVS